MDAQEQGCSSSGRLGSARLTDGLDDLREVIANVNDCMILQCKNRGQDISALEEM